jgi:predicted nuclease of predicted toxin-antitoxin system
VRILFDQGTPVPLRHALSGHEIVTVSDRDWGHLRNNDLLNAAESERFAAIITTDLNLRHQQILTGHRVAILVLRTMDWRLISRYTAQVSEAVAKLVAGTYIELQLPPQS